MTTMLERDDRIRHAHRTVQRSNEERDLALEEVEVARGMVELLRQEKLSLASQVVGIKSERDNARSRLDRVTRDEQKAVEARWVLAQKNAQLLEVNDAQARTIRRLDADMTMVRKSDRATIERLSYKVREAAESESAAYRRGRQDARKDIYEMLWAEGFRTNKVFRCLERAVPSDLMHVRDNNIHSLGMAPSPDVTPQCDAGVPWCMQNHFGLKSKKPPKCGKLICECSYPQCR
jgi:hypothetical protein